MPARNCSLFRHLRPWILGISPRRRRSRPRGRNIRLQRDKPQMPAAAPNGWALWWQRGGGPRGLPRMPKEAEMRTSRYGTDCQPQVRLARMAPVAAQSADLPPVIVFGAHAPEIPGLLEHGERRRSESNGGGRQVGDQTTEPTGAPGGVSFCLLSISNFPGPPEIIALRTCGWGRLPKGDTDAQKR